MQATVPLHGTFSAPAPSQFSIKGTETAAAYLDPSKSEIRLGALLPVLWEGNETSCVRFRTIGIYSRGGTISALPTRPRPAIGLAVTTANPAQAPGTARARA